MRKRCGANSIRLQYGVRPLQQEPLESRLLLAADPIISEFLASNQHSLVDEDGDNSDWIEIRNVGDQSIDLLGWHLTDEEGNPTKWTFPETSLPAGGHALIFASSKDRAGTGPAGEYHTNFRLDAGGEFLALVQPDGATFASRYAPEYPEQFTDISYGRSADGLSTGFFRKPTPGSMNASNPLADPQREVVFSEIMYHPSSHEVRDEYIEILNAGLSTVDLSAWQIRGGVDFVLPPVTIEPQAYLVIAADVAQFASKYPGVTNVVGDWAGQLSNSGETIELVDESGQSVDDVRFADEGDWSVRERGPVHHGSRGWVWSDQHDGGGRSLELINVSLPNDVGKNWGASSVDQGTPGAANSRSSSDIAPLILDTIHDPIVPRSSDHVSVTTRLLDESAVGVSARLGWRVDGTPNYNFVPMLDDGQSGDGAAGDGVFGTSIPPQLDRKIVEFYVEATDAGGRARTWPAPTTDEGQVANLLYQVDDAYDSNAAWTPGNPVEYRQIMTGAERAEFASMNPFSDAQMNATFISVTGTGTDVRYNVGVRYRGSNSRTNRPPNVPPNNRINFPSDQTWQGITALNINSVDVHDQIAGSALFRLSGLPAAEAKPARMLSNGNDLYSGRLYAHVEPLNSEFAANQFPTDSGGNLYKGRRPNESPPGGLGAGLNYHGPDPGPYVSYIKLTNAVEADYTDVIDLTARLNLSSDETYVDEVSEVVDVDQWARFLALNALLDNNEGGLSNGDPRGDDYAMYRGGADVRFRMIPHDLDTLFGDSRRAIFRARGNPALDRFFAQPEFFQKFVDQMRDLIDNVLSTELVSTTLDEGLRHVIVQDRIEAMKAFLAARSSFVLSRLSDNAATVTIETGLPRVGEFPRTTMPSLPLVGTAPGGSTQSVLVNGLPAAVLGDGSWSLSSGVSTPTEHLVSAGDPWRYLDDGSNQGTAWRQADFDDSRWDIGPAPLGYGDGDEGTVVGFIDTVAGGNVTKNATTYFRRDIHVSDPHEIINATIHLRYDDAAAIYLNGVEVVRTANLPNDAAYFTYANGRTPNEDRFFEFRLPAAALSALVEGQNTIAVEVHQASPTSSDIKFDLELVVQRVGSGMGAALSPGVNRILVQAFDGPDGTGTELARQTVDVWYDDGSEEEVSGALPGPVVNWTAAAGPYHVTSDVVIPPGTKLVIQPGTSVYFEEGTSLDVRGILDAQGTPFQRIRFTSVPNAPFVPDRPNGTNRLPNGPPRWRGIQFQNSTSDENIIAFADFDYAQNRRGSIGIDHSRVTVDSVSFRGTHAIMVSADSSSYVIRNSFFPDMFTADEDPAQLGLDGFAEQIKSVGAPPDSGRMLIQNNFFGTNKGHNDVIDAISGRRPDPILQILDNVFTGSGDEELDLGGDVYVAGNLFANVFKSPQTSDRGYSSAISTGDAEPGATVVVARNVFLNVDHAINLKNNDGTIFENNTVVHVHDDFLDQFGAVNIGSVVNLFVDEPGAIAGIGAYAADNIIWDAPRMFGNADLPAGEFTGLELHNNLLDPSLATTVGSRQATLLELGVGNRLGRAGFVDASGGNFLLRPDSPARGAGTFGQDLGALIRPGIWIAGEPPAVTGNRRVVLQVGGPGIFAYMFRVNGGPWSDEFPIGQGFDPAGGTIRSAMIALDDLNDGTYTVEALGQDFAGRWQEEPTVSTTWTVNTAEPRLLVNEVLAKNFVALEHFGAYPDLIELHNAGGAPIDLLGYSISDDLDNQDKYVFRTNTIIEPGEFLVLYADDHVDHPGIHVGFVLRGGGEGVYLFDSAATLVDGVAFGPQIRDLSIGRIGPAQQWQLTVPTFGAPNVSQPVGDSSSLRFNEWLAAADLLLDDDFVELFNPEPLPVSISGMFLSDEPSGNPKQHRIAPLSFIGPNGYVALIADGRVEVGGDHLAFRLDAAQEVLGLLDRQASLLDQVLYFPQTADVSQGRRPDGAPGYEFLAVPTPGTTNAQVGSLGDVVISEVHYHPVKFQDNSLSEDDLEFIELENHTSTPLDVSNWRLHEAVDFRFAAGTTIPAAGHIVVVPFDPLAEPTKATAFRALYQISAHVILVGGYDGQLSNRGDVVELSRPVASNLLITRAQYESVDRVRYRDSAPWPEQADGRGPALARRGLAGIGSSPNSWRAEDPTPGNDMFSATLGDVNRDGGIDSHDIDALHVAVRAGSVDSVFDLDRNGSVESADATFLVQTILQTQFGDANLDGTVDFADFLPLSSNFAAVDAGWAQGDFNGDGRVDFLDFLQLSHHFGFAAAL